MVGKNKIMSEKTFEKQVEKKLLEDIEFKTEIQTMGENYAKKFNIHGIKEIILKYLLKIKLSHLKVEGGDKKDLKKFFSQTLQLQSLLDGFFAEKLKEKLLWDIKQFTYKKHIANIVSYFKEEKDSILNLKRLTEEEKGFIFDTLTQALSEDKKVFKFLSYFYDP